MPRINKIKFNASFALVGLGVSVGIDLNYLYHTFFASAVSHCTPVPVTTINDTSCSINYGHFNILDGYWVVQNPKISTTGIT